MFDLLAQMPLQTWLDVTGSALVVVSLVFLIDKKPAYWHFSNLSLAPYFALFVLTEQYMLAGLQVSYLIFGLHGMWLWRLERLREAERMPFNERFWYNIGWVLTLLIFGFTVALSDFSNEWNLLQFVATSLALVANWATTRRWLWSWYVWLAVNALQAVLFFHLEFWAQFALQWVLAAMSMAGLLRWRQMRGERAGV
jgi:nicotinamide mononucleotide transporter